MSEQAARRTAVAPSRREFLKRSAAALSATSLAIGQSAHAAGSDVLKIGLIGCGGRGTGAAKNALDADPNVELAALADVFADRVGRSLKLLGAEYGERVKVPQDRQFVGFDAYQKLIASGVDVVLLATPPAFRPLHMRAAVEAGKHVFAEKSFATDGTAQRSMMESVELAKKKGLAIRSGLCFRFHPPHQEAFQRIHDGAIGDVLSIYVVRIGGSWGKYGLLEATGGQRPEGQSDLEWQLRNWYNFFWLSGGYMMDLGLHQVDEIAWIQREIPPVKCVASGGRQIPEYGNIYDHYDATFEYADGLLAVFKIRGWSGCHSEFRLEIAGSKGRCSLTWSDATIRGATEWAYKGRPRAMHQIEHDELFRALRAGNPPNDGDSMLKSNQMALMARESAHTGEQVTWEMATNSQQNLMPANLDWNMKLDVPPLTIPGITKFI
ncbi:MAG: Gfo/Idh/MocA family oxidoreductase [Rhodopirellula sp.]|nr:Gfo/Idh/MocA family oxidoreductase [Rhodopirellula sp.]